jgi:hypothetical protein
MPVEIGSYVELEDVFPGRERSLKHLSECLGALPLDLVLEMCARVNRLASGPSNLTLIERQRQLAGGILSPEALDNLKRATRRTEKGDPHKIALFFRAQLIELTRWALLFCDANAPPLGRSWNQQEKDLFVQAALICSWLSEVRVHAVLGENEDSDALKNIALVFFRQALDAGMIGVDLWRVVGRGRKLFLDYLPKHFPDFDQQFETATGLSPLEYMTASGALVGMHLQLEKTMIMTDATTLGHDTEYADVYRAYQNLQVWATNDLRARWWPENRVPDSLDEIPGLSLRPLRDKPMIALGNGRGAIPDSILLADSVTAGPLFYLLRVSNENEVFGRFGNAFEEYAHDVLASKFPQSSVLHQRLHLNVVIPAAAEDNGPFEIDACLDYVDQLVLIETKAVFLPDKSVVECDEAGFRAALEEKYLRGERPVGVGQLARTIRSLSTGAWQGPSPDSDIRLVYPVLVVHDRLLQEPMATSYLAELLVRELAACPVPGSWQWEVNGFCFAPLTILTIDDLENLESSSGIDVLDLLHSYSADVPKRNGSLHDYIASTERFRDELRINQTLAEATRGFLDDCVRRVFGRDPDEKDAQA